MNVVKNIDRVADLFCKAYEVGNTSPEVFPRITSGWRIDGKRISYRGMRKLVIPFVKSEIGFEPKAVTKVLWKIAVNVTRHLRINQK